MIDVSIVIVSWNSRDLIDQCLRSIEEKAGNIASETFVVDNASVDGSAELVERKFPTVRLIRNAQNVGFAKANNQAMRLSSGRYVLLLNPDTIILEDAIVRTVAFLDREPKAGIATCQVLNPDHTFQTCFGDAFPSMWMMVTGGTSLQTAFGSLWMSRRYIASSGVKQQDIDCAHPVAWVMGAFMMIRRKVIEEVGLLDEALFMYGEEPDYCYRAAKAGWTMWYISDGKIIHLGGQSTKAVDFQRTTDWLLTTYFYFFRKHFGTVYTIGCYLIGLVTSGLKLVMYGLLWMLSTGGVRQQRRYEKLLQNWYQTRWYLRRNPLGLVRRIEG